MRLRSSKEVILDIWTPGIDDPQQKLINDRLALCDLLLKVADSNRSWGLRYGDNVNFGSKINAKNDYNEIGKAFFEVATFLLTKIKEAG